MSGWDITEPMASKRQRASLYKLGYARSLVHQMSKEEASLAIQEGIARKGRIENIRHSLRTDGQSHFLTDVLCWYVLFLCYNAIIKPKGGYWYVLTDEQGMTLDIPCLNFYRTENKCLVEAKKAQCKHNAPDYYCGHTVWKWNRIDADTFTFKASTNLTY